MTLASHSNQPSRPPADESTALLDQDHNNAVFGASSTDRGSHMPGDNRLAGHATLHGQHGGPLVPDAGAIEIIISRDGDEDEDDEAPKKSSPYHDGISLTRFWIMMCGILSTYFIATFDSTFMASSHPVITSYFDASNSASWLSTAFLLTSTSFTPMLGRISDTCGRRPLYIISLIIFAATTAWCALAQSITSLIVARAFAGLGAGGVMSMGTIMINDLVSIEVRGTFQAYINIFFGFGAASGAAFGGALCDLLGWRGAFGVQIPVILAILLVAIFTTPDDLGPNLAKTSPKSTWQIVRSFDWLGSFMLTCFVACLILGLDLGGNIYPWSHPLIITVLILSGIAALLLLWIESRATQPVMPLPPLLSSPRGNMVFSNFFAQVGYNTIIFNLPLYFQAVKLDTPSMSGFRLAVPMAASTICGVLTGYFITWTGRMKAPQVVGAITMAAGSTMLALIWRGIPTWLVVIFATPLSIGQGLVFPATSIGVLAVTSKDEQAVMTSTLSLWRSLGTVMGVSVSSLLVQNVLSAELAFHVTGHNAHRIIALVRKSVRAVEGLPAEQRSQVQTAYENTLKFTFMSTVIYYVIVNVLLWSIKLDRLKKS